MAVLESTLALVYLSNSTWISLVGVTLYTQIFSNTQPIFIKSLLIISMREMVSFCKKPKIPKVALSSPSYYYSYYY